MKYAIEYSLGFDLRPEKFSVSADESGIVVTIGRPQLVASPSVKILSHEIPSKGILIDEKEAVIQLQQQLHDIAALKGREISREEPVVALCEKKNFRPSCRIFCCGRRISRLCRRFGLSIGEPFIYRTAIGSKLTLEKRSCNSSGLNCPSFCRQFERPPRVPACC